jgi:hypothetical protein
VFAQTALGQDQKFHFGLKIIPSMAWIKPDLKSVEREGRNLGFGYGVQTEFKLQENYVISSGVQVNYRGGSLKHEFKVDSISTASSTIDYRMQYIEIPVTLKMMTNEIHKIRYYGQFGFSPGFNIRSKTDPALSEEDDDFSDYTNKLNMNMIIGAGIHYTISGSTVIFAGIEFNNGFINIFDKDSKDLPWSDGVKSKGVTNTLGLNIGVLF